MDTAGLKVILIKYIKSIMKISPMEHQVNESKQTKSLHETGC